MRVTLWLEDLRPPPEGWVWAKIVEEAKALLVAGRDRSVSGPQPR